MQKKKRFCIQSLTRLCLALLRNTMQPPHTRQQTNSSPAKAVKTVKSHLTCGVQRALYAKNCLGTKPNLGTRQLTKCRCELGQTLQLFLHRPGSVKYKSEAAACGWSGRCLVKIAVWKRRKRTPRRKNRAELVLAESSRWALNRVINAPHSRMQIILLGPAFTPVRV